MTRLRVHFTLTKSRRAAGTVSSSRHPPPPLRSRVSSRQRTSSSSLHSSSFISTTPFGSASLGSRSYEGRTRTRVAALRRKPPSLPGPAAAPLCIATKTPQSPHPRGGVVRRSHGPREPPRPPPWSFERPPPWRSAGSCASTAPPLVAAAAGAPSCDVSNPSPGPRPPPSRVTLPWRQFIPTAAFPTDANTGSSHLSVPRPSVGFVPPPGEIRTPPNPRAIEATPPGAPGEVDGDEGVVHVLRVAGLTRGRAQAADPEHFGVGDDADHEEIVLVWRGGCRRARRASASMSSLMRPPSLARTTLWGRSMHGCPWNVHRMPVPKEWGLVTAHMSGGGGARWRGPRRPPPGRASGGRGHPRTSGPWGRGRRWGPPDAGARAYSPCFFGFWRMRCARCCCGWDTASPRDSDMATERVSSGKKGIRTLVGSERSARTMEDARERPLECARGVAGTVGRTRRTCVRVASCAAQGRRRRVVAHSET